MRNSNLILPTTISTDNTQPSTGGHHTNGTVAQTGVLCKTSQHQEFTTVCCRGLNAWQYTKLGETKRNIFCFAMQPVSRDANKINNHVGIGNLLHIKTFTGQGGTGERTTY